jgi:hypothetical protein
MRYHWVPLLPRRNEFKHISLDTKHTDALLLLPDKACFGGEYIEYLLDRALKTTRALLISQYTTKPTVWTENKAVWPHVAPPIIASKRLKKTSTSIDGWT